MFTFIWGIQCTFTKFNFLNVLSQNIQAAAFVLFFAKIWRLAFDIYSLRFYPFLGSKTFLFCLFLFIPALNVFMATKAFHQSPALLLTFHTSQSL